MIQKNNNTEGEMMGIYLTNITLNFGFEWNIGDIQTCSIGVSGSDGRDQTTSLTNKTNFEEMSNLEK
jgi:hypothetical protein